MLTIKRKCTICGGDGIDKEKTGASGGSMEIPCPNCKGIGHFLDDTIDIEEITDKLDSVDDKVNDVMDKCNDILERLNET